MAFATGGRFRSDESTDDVKHTGHTGLIWPGLSSIVVLLDSLSDPVKLSEAYNHDTEKQHQGGTSPLSLPPPFHTTARSV